MSDESARRAFVITALPEEFAAVREHLVDLQEQVHPAETVYETGIFQDGESRWQVAIVQASQGNVAAAMEVERGIRTFSPDVVLMVGVAGGLKDVEIGDVVVANKVYGFEVGKESDGFQSRPGFGQVAYGLLQRAQSIARNNAWQHRIRAARNAAPNALVGAIASGEKVIASTRSRTYKLIRQNQSDALAVETEGYGVLQAIHANLAVRGLVVRGISDLIVGKAESDASGSQTVAAQNAAAFAFQLLAEYGRGERPPEAPAPPTAQRVYIREKSAAEILVHLNEVTLSSRFHKRVEELYVGRWTREPGWQTTVLKLPSKRSEEVWFCSFMEVGSGTLVVASTVQDVSTLRRGDSVTVRGRISDVGRQYVSLEDAIVRGD